MASHVDKMTGTETPTSQGKAGTLPFGPEPAPKGALAAGLDLLRLAPRTLLRAPILLYRYTLSLVMGRQCRYLPTCSAYADEAIARHGAWPGAFMATARICRCHPWGGHGFDPVPQCLPVEGRWYAPWRYGLWRMPKEVGQDAQGPAPDLPSEGAPKDGGTA